MLDRAGDADGDVELGRDDLAGLADLVVVGRDSPRRPRRGWRRRRRQLVGERFEQLEILAEPMPRPPETTILAAVSSGRSDLTSSSPTNLDSAGTAAAAIFSIGGAAAVGRRLEGGRAHGDDLLGVRRLHGLHRVAGIDRAHEGVGRSTTSMISEICGDVEQGGDARQDSSCRGGGRRQDGVVVVGASDRISVAIVSASHAWRRRASSASSTFARRRSWRRPRRRRRSSGRRPARAPAPQLAPRR